MRRTGQKRTPPKRGSLAWSLRCVKDHAAVVALLRSRAGRIERVAEECIALGGRQVHVRIGSPIGLRRGRGRTRMLRTMSGLSRGRDASGNRDREKNKRGFHLFFRVRDGAAPARNNAQMSRGWK